MISFLTGKLRKKNFIRPIRNLLFFQLLKLRKLVKKIDELVKGLCNWCGTGGFCCRKELKLAYIGNGCDGNVGGDNYHACAIPPGT